LSPRAKIGAITAAILIVAGVAYWVLANQDVPLPGRDLIAGPETCPLTDEAPKGGDDKLSRPAIAVKVENATLAYPLSGLEDADLVYEEVVEGGLTRFMAVYHCGDSNQVGPVRSARLVDPAIMSPTTRLLAFSGGNQIVLDNLKEHDIVQIDESNAGDAMKRIPREGLTTEHTLYGNTQKLRSVGEEQFSDSPGGIFEFGKLEGNTRNARSITINFSTATTVTYDWNGERWARSQAGGPFESEGHGQVGVDNVIVEMHTVRNSDRITDAAGNPSVEIADETGSGRAILFRDAQAIEGKWSRDSIEDAVSFEADGGGAMKLKPGNTWIHLVPNNKGDVMGSVDFGK
jgi:hypothetical protein